MIVKIIDLYDFMREFERYDRGDRFSNEALERLFDYHDDLGESYELDVIEICCNWTEAKSLDEFAQLYGYTEEVEGMSEEEKEDYLLHQLDRNTFYTYLDNGGVLFRNY